MLFMGGLLGEVRRATRFSFRSRTCPPGRSGLETSIGTGFRSGAAEGTRTLDIQLGKLTLYQLSYSRSQGSVKLLAGGEDSAECAGQEGLRVFEKN